MFMVISLKGTSITFFSNVCVLILDKVKKLMRTDQIFSTNVHIISVNSSPHEACMSILA